MQVDGYRSGHTIGVFPTVVVSDDAWNTWELVFACLRLHREFWFPGLELLKNRVEGDVPDVPVLSMAFCRCRGPDTGISCDSTHPVKASVGEQGPLSQSMLSSGLVTSSSLPFLCWMFLSAFPFCDVNSGWCP